MSTHPNQAAAMDLHDHCIRRLLGCALALVLTTPVAQAQNPFQRIVQTYTDCTYAAFRAHADQVNDPNLLAEMSLAACPTEETAVLAFYRRFAPSMDISLLHSQLKLRLKQQMIESAKTRHSPPAKSCPPNTLAC
jgi:hypothetical protein